MFKKISLLLILICSFMISENSIAQMYWNHAASFLGSTSSYIKCRNSPSLNLTGSFTLEAWINPNTLAGFSKGIISKGTSFGTSLIYGMRLEPTGRIMVATNGSAKLRTKATSVIPVNKWTHIAATYNLANGLFSIYINGSLDTSAIVAGAAPNSNTDTLYFGISGSTTPFSGMMDEIRIWNRELPSIQIRNNMRTSVSAFGGVYDGLVLSLTFQTQYHNVPQFNISDWSPNFNTCINNGANDVDLSDVPSETICPNQAATFGGLDDYCAGADNAYLSPADKATFQAWIFPRSDANAVIIHKGTPNGATTNYSLNIINKKLAAKVDGITFDSGDTLELNRWTHVAFTFNYITSLARRSYSFIVNGKQVKGGVLTGGSAIDDGADSLYIGGTIGLSDFNGLIDEVRISRYVKLINDIADSMFIPMNFNVATLQTSVSYSFDGYSRGNTPLGPNLFFRNFGAFMIAIFSPVSPLDKSYTSDFQKSFYLKHSGKRIPESGLIGTAADTFDIYLDENISDINVFASIDHSNSSSLEIDLIGPDGSSARLFENNSLLSNNEAVVTIFDDNAATSLLNNTFTSFSPSVKSFGNLNSVFAGKSTRGLWKLKVTDESSIDTGIINAWGIQFNNKTVLPKVLRSNNLIQGFYDPSSDAMVRDTMRCYIRSYNSPYPLIDSAISYLTAQGEGSFTFSNPSITNITYYYFQLKHRNSIEVWNNIGTLFPVLTSQTVYNFASDSSMVFGLNVKRVDDSPVRYASYGGDADLDGSVDLSDITNCFNDASAFATGYLNTDMTGDDIADLTDITITFNNSANFVTKITP